MASLKELDSPFKPYPRAEIVESPFLQLELANPASRDQDTWMAEARFRPASTRGTISGQYHQQLIKIYANFEETIRGAEKL